MIISCHHLLSFFLFHQLFLDFIITHPVSIFRHFSVWCLLCLRPLFLFYVSTRFTCFFISFFSPPSTMWPFLFWPSDEFFLTRVNNNRHTNTHKKGGSREKKKKKTFWNVLCAVVVERAARANKRSLIGLISGGLVFCLFVSPLYTADTVEYDI